MYTQFLLSNTHVLMCYNLTLSAFICPLLNKPATHVIVGSCRYLNIGVSGYIFLLIYFGSMIRVMFSSNYKSIEIHHKEIHCLYLL